MRSFFKRSSFLIIISVLIILNLAIQIARFNSYTIFMKNLKMNVRAVRIEKEASEVIINLNFVITTKERNVHAYVTGIQLILNMGNVDLGYHPIVGNQDMIGKFKDGVFNYVGNVKLLEDQAVNFLKFMKEKKLSYKAYVEIHVVQGGHVLRSVPLFEGTIERVIK